MKNILSSIFLLFILMFWSSCRDDLEFETRTGGLRFSRDTIYLDTVFSNIGSSTYNLKVYNSSNKDVVIPNISLARGQSSNYRLNVDGMAGKSFDNVELLAKDSLYIFVETTIDIQNEANNPKEFLYTDQIEFHHSSDFQKVELVTLVKDAYFIYPNKSLDPSTGNSIVETLTFDVDGDGIDDETEVQGRFLNDNELHFTNDKPYVIYGYAAVGNGKTLEIDAGSRIHFHANSGLIITNGASLWINGALSLDQVQLENEVIFEGDRLEPEFANTPGQWGTIWLFNGSTNNQINYTTIKNGGIGLLVEGNQSEDFKLNIANSQIYNSAYFGLMGRATSIKGENLVINKSGQSSFAGLVGGHYDFTHCTFANYWSDSFRQFPAVYLNNYFADEDENIITNDLNSTRFKNCIIYGNDNPELILDPKSSSSFDVKFSACLIKFDDPNNVFSDPWHDFGNTDFYENIFLNLNPNFKNPTENQLQIGEESDANGRGSIEFSTLVPYDILGKTRVDSPDLGAYQHIIFMD
ncbi:hypothetical protein [Aegicerativicinus sediminis]